MNDVCRSGFGVRVAPGITPSCVALLLTSHHHDVLMIPFIVKSIIKPPKIRTHRKCVSSGKKIINIYNHPPVSIWFAPLNPLSYNSGFGANPSFLSAKSNTVNCALKKTSP